MSKDKEQSRLSKALGIKRQGSFITLPSPMSSAKGATISTEPAELTEEEMEARQSRRRNIMHAVGVFTIISAVVTGCYLIGIVAADWSTARSQEYQVRVDDRKAYRKATLAAAKEACDNGPRSACVDYAQLKYPPNTQCGY